MKLRKKFNLTVMDVLFVAIGLILLLLIAYINIPSISAIFEAIGTSLIAAGLVAYLTRRFFIEERRDVIEVAAPNRMILENVYRQEKYKANEVDIVGIALSGCLKELADDQTEKMLKRVLFDRAAVRLLFLNPSGSYVPQRALEDAIPVDELKGILNQSIIYCVKIYGRLARLHKSATENEDLERAKIGSFQIRVTGMCPHFTTFRTDEKILWGLYTFGRRGLDSPALQVPKEQSVLFSQLTTHFEKLWDRSDDSYLVRYYEPNVPTCNEKLFEEILGADWKKYLDRPNP